MKNLEQAVEEALKEAMENNLSRDEIRMKCLVSSTLSFAFIADELEALRKCMEGSD